MCSKQCYEKFLKLPEKVRVIESESYKPDKVLELKDKYKTDFLPFIMPEHDDIFLQSWQNHFRKHDVPFIVEHHVKHDKDRIVLSWFVMVREDMAESWYDRQRKERRLPNKDVA